MGFLDTAGLQYYDSKIKAFINDKTNPDIIANSISIKKAGMVNTQWNTKGGQNVYRVEYKGNRPQNADNVWDNREFDIDSTYARGGQSGYRSAYLEVRPGDVCYIRSRGAKATIMGWGFLSSKGFLLESSVKSFNGEAILFAPLGAAYVFVNVSYSVMTDPYLYVIPRELYTKASYRTDKIVGYARRDSEEIKNIVLHGEPDAPCAITSLYMYGENRQDGIPTPSSPVDVKPMSEGFDSIVTVSGNLTSGTDFGSGSNSTGGKTYRWWRLFPNVYGTAMGDGGSGTDVSSYLPINIQSTYLPPIHNAMYINTDGIRVSHDGSEIHLYIRDFFATTSDMSWRFNNYLSAKPLTIWYKSEDYNQTDPVRYYAGGVYSEDGSYCGFGTTEKIAPLYRWDRIDVMTGTLTRYTNTKTLGALTWTLTNGVFRAQISDMATLGNTVSCNMYKCIDKDDSYSENDKIIYVSDGYVYINDNTYSTASDFNAACGSGGALEDGVIYYESESPVESEVTLEGIWGVDNVRGEMEIMGNGYFEVEYAANAVAMETEMPERCEGAYVANSYVSSSQYENGFMCFTKGRNALVININLTTSQALPANIRVKIGTVGRKPVNETVTNIIGTNGTVAQLIIDAAGNACLFSVNGTSGTDTYAGTMFVSTL